MRADPALVAPLIWLLLLSPVAAEYARDQRSLADLMSPVEWLALRVRRSRRGPEDGPPESAVALDCGALHANAPSGARP